MAILASICLRPSTFFWYTSMSKTSILLVNTPYVTGIAGTGIAGFRSSFIVTLIRIFTILTAHVLKSTHHIPILEMYSKVFFALGDKYGGRLPQRKRCYLLGLLRIIRAAITPGTQPQIHRTKTMMTDPQPLSKTARGGKKIASNTRQILMLASFVQLMKLFS